MSTEAEQTPDATEASGLSRRHILQGVAWATPAVVIATAAPAAAVSAVVQQAVVGALSVVSPTAAYASSHLTVGAQVAYSGAQNGAPVTGLTVTMTFSGSVLSGGQTPTAIPNGWTFLGWTSAPNSGTYVFTFRYDGGALSVAQPAAAPLSAKFANWQTWGGAVAIAAAGTSLNVPVTASASAMPAQPGVLVWNSMTPGVTATYPPPNYTKVVQTFTYNVVVRHNGPQNPNGAAATGLVVTAAYDPAKVNAPAAATVGDWVLTPLGISGGVGRVSCAYQGTVAYGASTSALALVLTAKSGATSSAVTFTGAFTSAGVSGTIAAQAATAA